MRLDRVYIDGFKNLKEVEVDFDKSRLTTVIIGQNGAGKSNLIEAITDIFRFVDLNRQEPRFKYEVDYRIGNHAVRLSNRAKRPTVSVDGTLISRDAFNASRSNYFPDLVFGYYSGGSRRLESLFDSHQRRYYGVINKEAETSEYKTALSERRLFYCRPIHGVLSLLTFFAFPDPTVSRLLQEKLKITKFHSALAHFKEPSWFSHETWKRSQSSGTTGATRGRRTYNELASQARDVWGAKGPAGACGRAFLENAFHPLALTGKVIDDYRDKQQVEAQLACFLREGDALGRLASTFKTDQEMFAALEALDISDLFREMLMWVERSDDTTGDVSFADLSDGERQLLMVLGLIRVSRNQRALFLLDEPDTHLNPAWQHTYLELIQQWAGETTNAGDRHIILTSHNPLTIAALDRQEVRVMHAAEDGKISVSAPYADPRGMGFTATLTEIFGLPSSLDQETQRQLDERNALARIERRTEEQERQLIQINDALSRLGFMFEDREPLYQDFLRAWQEERYADKPPLSPDEIERRHLAMSALIKELIAKRETPN
jgi:ABC-type cobalamin/Fe3+-siderophores transport system ATPase subunit